MLVKLTHPFMWHCRSPQDLVGGCLKLNTFCRNLEGQARLVYPDNPNESEEEAILRENNRNKYKGDGFELFVEALIRLSPCDKRLATIEDYEVVTSGDTGVDGYGICGFNGKPITVQVKYRQHDHVLSANNDHLTNFTSSSFMRYNVDPNPEEKTQKCNLLIITSGNSLNFYTDVEMFQSKVFAICRDELRQFVDNNRSFWKFFLQSWEASLEQLQQRELA